MFKSENIDYFVKFLYNHSSILREKNYVSEYALISQIIII